jgi:transketolase
VAPKGSILAAEIRRTVIEQSKRAGVGHIGSALSIADIVAAVVGDVLYEGETEGARDRLVLSKGHAALALYAALEATGKISRGELDTFCGDGTPFGVHPEHVAPGIDFSTGSLGHGLPVGTGAALAARIESSKRRVFVVMSDAELNEGSIWEAAMFAAHHRLGNLALIIDVNGQQALGHTPEVIDMARLPERWSSFGWDVHEVDGHDPEGLAAKLGTLDADAPPHVLLASTTFGKGVSFMESKVEWHYWPLDDAQYAQAMGELDSAEVAG